MYICTTTDSTLYNVSVSRVGSEVAKVFVRRRRYVFNGNVEKVSDGHGHGSRRSGKEAERLMDGTVSLAEEASKRDKG
jgi:hypothetical protein